MSALGRNLGNFIQTFSTQSSSFSTIKGLRTGLLSCCGSSVRPLPTDNHHGHSSLISVKSAVTGIKTNLFNNEFKNQFTVRQYCSSGKLQVSPTPKTLLSNICENEINDFRNIFPETNSDIETFLEESGFELTKDGETAILKKTFADGTAISIRFDTMEQQYQDEYDENEGYNENEEGEEHDEEEEQEEEEQEEEKEEEEEHDEEQEQDEEGEEGEGEEEGDAHEHPFEIEITPKGKESGKLTFGCYASHDGNYTISGFYKGGFNESVNPVDIGGTSMEFQDNILLLLQSYDVNERLSFFIHDYVHGKKVNDYIDSFEALKDFVSKE